MTREQSTRMAAEAVLAGANPAPDSTVAESWRDPVGRAAYEAIVHTPLDGKADRVRPQPQPPARPRLRRRRFVIGTGLVAASVAAGLVTALVISGAPTRLLHGTGTGTGTGTQATGTAPMLHYVLTGVAQPDSAINLPPARSILLRLARAAGNRAPIAQPPGARISYALTNEWYMSVAVAGGTNSSVVTPEVDRTWTAPDSAWRHLARRGRPLVLGDGSPQTLKAAEAGPPVSDDRGRAGDTSNGPLVGHLSLNPTVLKPELLKAPPVAGGAPVSYRLFSIITLLHHQIVSPGLDAAMWRVLATRSDVRYLGRVTDRAGRVGAAVAYTDPTGQERVVLIISPATGQLLGWEQIFLRNPGALTLKSYPAVVAYVSFLSEHWTTTMGGSAR